MRSGVTYRRPRSRGAVLSLFEASPSRIEPSVASGRPAAADGAAPVAAVAASREASVGERAVPVACVRPHVRSSEQPAWLTAAKPAIRHGTTKKVGLWSLQGR